MDQSTTAPALSFRKRLFGYDPVEVDSYLVRAIETHEAVRAEVERLRAAEPLARVGGDVANLLTSFAETVSGMRDEAAAEIDQLRAETTAQNDQQRADADDYASQQRAQADQYAMQQRVEADEYATRQRAEAEQVLAEAKGRARLEADAILEQARQELAVVAARWSVIEGSLNDASSGISSALAAVKRVSGFSPSDTIDIADRQLEAVADPPSNSGEDPEHEEEDGTVLPSLAAKMYQTRQSRPETGSGGRLQYLLPRLGGQAGE